MGAIIFKLEFVFFEDIAHIFLLYYFYIKSNLV